jgi:hypothetical protein
MHRFPTIRNKQKILYPSLLRKLTPQSDLSLPYSHQISETLPQLFNSHFENLNELIVLALRLLDPSTFTVLEVHPSDHASALVLRSPTLTKELPSRKLLILQ